MVGRTVTNMAPTIVEPAVTIPKACAQIQAPLDCGGRCQKSSWIAPSTNPMKDHITKIHSLQMDPTQIRRKQSATRTPGKKVFATESSGPLRERRFEALQSNQTLQAKKLVCRIKNTATI